MQPKEKIISIIKKETGLKDIPLEIPPDSSMGDFAFPCFILSKEMKKKPFDIAKELSEKIKPKGILKEVKANGPYLNFFLDNQTIGQKILDSVIKEKKNYGKDKSKKEKILIEFSGPNPFKGFHIGHLRNTALGESVSRLLSFAGYEVMPVNYLNDTGKHVAKCIWGIENLYKNDIPRKEDKGEWLGKVYSEASILIESNPKHKEEADEIHQKLEEKNKHYIDIWKKGKEWSEEHFNDIYKELDVHFKKVFYDSEYIDKGKEVINKLSKKGIAQTDQGAMIIDLEEFNLHKVLVLRTDGTALYITKDLAMAMDRLNNYDVDRMIYVVGSEQKLHFNQVFKILNLYGFKQAEKCYHLSYELVRLKEGKMSSRKGGVVLYSDLANAVKKKLEIEVEKRHPKWSKKRKLESVNNIFSSAIKFDMLIQDPNKVIVFDVDKALDFEGETGPYVQYTHARICSVLNKVSDVRKAEVSNLLRIEEESLMKKIGQFPDAIKDASQDYKPSIVARYLIELSQSFNNFYSKCPIINDDKELQKSRTYLIKCVKQVIENGLAILAIKAPEEM